LLKLIKREYRNYSRLDTFLFLMVAIMVLLNLFDKNEFKVSLSSLSFAVAYFSLLLIVLFYEKKLYDDKIHSIILLKKQLEIIGVWTSYQKGGYHKWDQDDVQTECSGEWGNPFSNIYNPEASALSQIITLPGTCELGDQVIENLVALNQEITSFNNSLDEIRNFKYSRDCYKNIMLHLKNGAKKSEKIKNLLIRSKISLDLEPEEEAFKTKLVEFYSVLHFNIIGDDNTQRLFYWHKKTYDSVVEKEKWIKGEI
jgi:hypothetical protein